MSLKFGEVKDINVGGMQIVPIRMEDDKPFYVTTGKCFSFGVKHKKKFKTASMSLKLDDGSASRLQDILDQCGEDMGAPLTKRLFYKDNTIYPKLRPTSKLYEGTEEVDVSKYGDRACDVKAVLEMGGILLNGDKTSLQVKVYKALVRDPVQEHVRLIGTKW